MKKSYIILISLALTLLNSVSSAQKNPTWSWPQCRNYNGGTPEQPATIYLGDQGTFGHDSWADVDGKWPKWRVFIYTSANIDAGTNGAWSGYSNVQHKTNTSPRFTSTGTWYWGMQVEYTDAGGTTGWYCKNNANWANMYGTPISDLTITVSALNNPSSQTTSVSGTSVTLNWSKDAQNHNVMIVRKKASDSWTEPTQGTGYVPNATIGSGTVVYNGSGTNSSDMVSSSTDYDYKFYSENYSYYSSGVTASASTLTAATDYFRSKASSDWSIIGTWESSGDNAYWKSATTSPGATANTTSILNTHTVTLTSATNVNSLTINPGGTLACGSNTINISSNAVLTNNGTFGSGAGTVAFTGTGTVSGTVGFNNVSISGGVNFGSGSTIKGTLTINTGGYVNINAPIYATGSTLKYNSATTYGRGTEWSNASGAGYPYHLQISNNTSLNVNNGANAQRQIAGNLTVDNGCTFSMEGMTIGSPTVIGVIISGHIINNGIITLSTSTERLKAINFTNNSITTLSTNIGGDLEIAGNLIDNSTFNANTRAVFFTGSGTQDVSGSSSPFNIDYIVITKSAGSVRMLQNLLCEGPNGGNALTFSSVSDILDLNGFTLSFGKNAVNSIITGPGYFKGSSSSGLSISGSGTMGTIKFDQTTPGTTNVLKNLIIDRPASDAVTLGNNLTVAEMITTTVGTTLTIPGSTTLSIGENCQATILGPLINYSGITGLVVKSDASGTGSLIHNTANIDGTVERYMNNAEWSNRKDGWHFLSSPVISQAISPDFTSEPYDFYCWYEPANTWVNYKNTTVSPTWNAVNGSQNFNIGKGYMAAYDEAGTKSFSGKLNVADAPVSGLIITGTAQTNRSWHLLGNPFSSALTWDAGTAWAMTNISGVAKIWNEGIQDYTELTSTPPTVIPAANGFMVQVSAGTGNLTLPAIKRAHSVQPFYKAVSSIPQIKLITSTDDKSSAKETTVIIYPDATEGFDLMYDGEFLHGYGPEFYSVQGDLKLSTNTLPELHAETIIPMGFTKNYATNFSIELKESIEGYTVYLKDLKTNTDQNLSDNPVYFFNSEAIDDPNRFLLHFKSTLGTEKPTSLAPMRIYTTEGKICVTGVTDKAEMIVRNMLGQLVIHSSFKGDDIYILNAGNLPFGVYVVSVVSNKQTLTGKVLIR